MVTLSLNFTKVQRKISAFIRTTCKLQEMAVNQLHERQAVCILTQTDYTWPLKIFPCLSLSSKFAFRDQICSTA